MIKRAAWAPVLLALCAATGDCDCGGMSNADDPSLAGGVESEPSFGAGGAENLPSISGGASSSDSLAGGGGGGGGSDFGSSPFYASCRKIVGYEFRPTDCPQGPGDKGNPPKIEDYADQNEYVCIRDTYVGAAAMYCWAAYCYSLSTDDATCSARRDCAWASEAAAKCAGYHLCLAGGLCSDSPVIGPEIPCQTEGRIGCPIAVPGGCPGSCPLAE